MREGGEVIIPTYLFEFIFFEMILDPIAIINKTVERMNNTIANQKIISATLPHRLLR